MATKGRKARRTGSKPTRRSSSSAGRGRRRSTAGSTRARRSATARNTSVRGGTVKLVVEHAPASTVARPEGASGIFAIPDKPGRSKF